MGIDINNFNEINEKYDYEFGDEVLVHVVKIFNKCIRTIDFIYRNGSNEFLFVLPETPALGALEVGNRIRKKLLREYITPKGEKTPVAISISGGISSFKVDAETTKELIEFALEALNSARKDGGNKIYLYFQEKRKFGRNW